MMMSTYEMVLFSLYKLYRGLSVISLNAPVTGHILYRDPSIFEGGTSLKTNDNHTRIFSAPPKYIIIARNNDD